MTVNRLKFADPTKPPQPDRFTFTKTELLRLQPRRDKQRWAYDTKADGLALCITPNGARTFYFAKRVDGRYRRVKIGDLDIGVENARHVARKHLGDIAKGGNPAEAKRIARQEMTFAQAFDHYLTSHAKPKKKTWREDEQKYNDYCRRWRTRKITTIKRSDIQALITEIGSKQGKPGAANRTAIMLSSMFNIVILDFDLPMANPVRGVRKFKERPRERYLNADELRRFMAALKCEKQLFQDFFTMALLTGARSGNVKAMRWEQIRFDDEVWTIPSSETKKDNWMAVPLSPPAMEILNRRYKIAMADAVDEINAYVFPSRRRHGKCPHMSEPKTAWNRIITKAKLSDFRIHDLRHTCATWQGKQGATLHTIGRSLGQKRPAVTAIYTHTETDAVRQSVNAAADAMMKAANK